MTDSAPAVISIPPPARLAVPPETVVFDSMALPPATNRLPPDPEAPAAVPSDRVDPATLNVPAL